MVTRQICWHLPLAFTRYCYHQSCMAHGIQKEVEGGHIRPNSRAIVLQQCGQCSRAGRMTGRLIRQTTRSKRISCKAKPPHPQGLVAATRNTELLTHKAARAHLSTLPYGTPAKLTQGGGVLLTDPSPPKSKGPMRQTPPSVSSVFGGSIFVLRSTEEKRPLCLADAFPPDHTAYAVEAQIEIQSRVQVRVYGDR